MNIIKTCFRNNSPFLTTLIVGATLVAPSSLFAQSINLKKLGYKPDQQVYSVTEGAEELVRKYFPYLAGITAIHIIADQLRRPQLPDTNEIVFPVRNSNQDKKDNKDEKDEKECKSDSWICRATENPCQKEEANPLTWPMRSPSLVQYLLDRVGLASARTTSNQPSQNWVILGPGLMQFSYQVQEGDNQTPRDINSAFAPQVHEIAAFIRPIDRLEIVDIEQRTLDAISSGAYVHWLASLTLGALQTQVESQSSNDRTNWSSLDSFVRQIPERLDSFQNIQSVRADFTRMQLRNNSVDFLIATLSLMYPLKELDNKNRIRLFGELLGSLRPQGEIIIDTATMKAFAAAMDDTFLLVQTVWNAESRQYSTTQIKTPIFDWTTPFNDNMFSPDLYSIKRVK